MDEYLEGITAKADRFKDTEEAISLHGLGFLQVKLGGRQRLHVWHPALPRRKCFAHSAIHDHRFSFTSTVLVGVQRNHIFKLWQNDHSGTHYTYKHEGLRSRYGNRPWLRDERVSVRHMGEQAVRAGESYQMAAYLYHMTEPGGDGRVATLMTKTWESDVGGAHSTCTVGVEPDVDFDRKQMSPGDMWAVVREVLESA